MMIEENKAAPEFSLFDQDGHTVRLSDFRGKKVLVYFYPKDDTPGCTKEACSLRDGFAELTGKNTVVLGISPDKAESHVKFRTKYQLPFTLLSDPEHKVMGDWGAWGEKKLYGKVSVGVLRSSFVIDEAGVVKKIIRKVDTAAHAAQVMPWLQ